jgi:hypothetical protein
MVSNPIVEAGSVNTSIFTLRKFWSSLLFASLTVNIVRINIAASTSIDPSFQEADNMSNPPKDIRILGLIRCESCSEPFATRGLYKY